MADNDLEIIVQKARHGDENALIELASCISKPVLFKLSYLLNNSSDAEDVAQEVLIRVCLNIGSLKDPKLFTAWLNRIICNERNSYLARNHKHTNVLDIDDYIDFFVVEDDDVLPYEFIEKDEIRLIIVETIRQLPKRQMQAVIMHYYDDMTITETAKEMGTSKSAIVQYLATVRDKIRLAIEKQQFYEKEKIPASGIAALSMGPMISQSLQMDYAAFSPASDLWLAQVMAKVKASKSGEVAAAAIMKKAPLMVGLLSAAVVCVFVAIVNLDFPVRADGDIPEAIVAVQADARILFSGGNPAYPFVNPTEARAQIDTESHHLLTHTWWIEPKDGGEALFRGEGAIVVDPLLKMQEEGKEGEYKLWFNIEDDLGGVYTIGRVVIITTENA